MTSWGEIMAESDITLTCPHCNLKSREDIAQDYFSMFVNRFDTMFEWTGLPETIPEHILERYLKINGWCGIGKHPTAEGLYCFFGGLGGQPDEYYRPTEIVMANPVLGSKNYKIGVDVVWAKNDSLHKGISGLLSRYSHLLAANDVSIHVAQINSRIPFAFVADTEAGVTSVKSYLKQIEDGSLAVIQSSSFNKGVVPTSLSTGSGDYLKALIELHQYLKSQCWLDFGINSNFNMKRERQNVAEVEANAPALLPYIDEMLKFRKTICSEVNKMFPDQNWDVKLNSAWKLENETQVKQVEMMGESEEQEDDESSQLEEDKSDEVS